MAINNIFNCKVDTLELAPSLFVVNTIHLALANKQKYLGSSIIGDGGVNVDVRANLSIDPDLIDQTRVLP
jgi:hypothetical protein